MTWSKADQPLCILLTAYGSISDAVAAVKKGAFDFVAKPVKLDKLESVIDAALASRKKNISPSNPAEPASEPAAVPIRPVSPEGEPLVLPPRAAATPWHGSSLSQRPLPLPAPLC